MTESSGEVRELPKGWTLAKIGDLGEVVTGNTPSKKDSSFFNGTIPFYKPTDLDAGYEVIEAREYLSELGASHSRIIPAFSILVTCIGATIGKTGLARKLCATNQQINAVVASETHINSKWLFWMISSPKGQQMIIDNSSATTMPIINKSRFTELIFPVPPFNEQNQIVEKIEELFSELDQGIESLKTAQKQLKVYRQAVLKWAFEGKLTEEWRTQHPPTSGIPPYKGGNEGGQALLAQIKAERENRYQQQLAEWETAVKEWEAIGKVGKKPSKPQTLKELSPITKSEFSKLPHLPANWSWAKIGNIAWIGTGVTPLKKKNEYYENGNIPWVTSGALNESYVRKASDFVTELALKETNLRIYPKHTLLVALYGEGKTRGKCSELLIESTTNQAIAAIIQDTVDGKIRPYLKYFLQKNYDEIRLKSSGGVQPNLNLSIVENTIFPLCSLEEQEQIVEEIESRLSTCDQLEATLIENLQKAEALRQSILKQAFAGKLVPQDPNDEPAETLLERIKAERQANQASKASNQLKIKGL